MGFTIDNKLFRKKLSAVLDYIVEEVYKGIIDKGSEYLALYNYSYPNVIVIEGGIVCPRKVRKRLLDTRVKNSDIVYVPLKASVARRKKSFLLTPLRNRWSQLESGLIIPESVALILKRPIKDYEMKEGKRIIYTLRDVL